MSDEKTDEKAAKETTKKTRKKKAAAKVVEEGSLVYVDYVARTKDDGKVFDLTIEHVAKEEGVFKEDSRYKPVLVVVGWNWLLEALEKELIGMREGESKRVEISPEQGAGVRDPKKVKMIAKAKLTKRGIKIAKGEEITFGNERGVITQVLGRTVRVDFNSPLAGKTLVFNVTVREIITKTEDKIMAIVKRRVPGIPEDRISVTARGDVVTVELPPESRYYEGVQYAELGIARDVLKIHDPAKKVKLVVTFERPEETE